MFNEKSRKIYFSDKLFNNFIYNLNVINMKVKIFDEEHESDLEKMVNDFLKDNDIDVIEIKYQVAISVCGEDQLYCFSAMIIYN